MSTSSSIENEIETSRRSSHILNGSLSYEVTVTKNSNPSINVYGFSNKFEFFDIEILYRKERGDEWLSDMYIQSTTAAFIKDNKVFKLQSSPNGSLNIIKWDCQKNGFDLGASFQIKINVLPTLKTLNYYGSYTIEEGSYPNVYNEMDGIIPYKVIGIDNYGNYMVFDNGRFLIVDKNYSVILVVNNIANAICAQQMNNGNYLILDEQASKIIEVSNSGQLIYEMGSVDVLNQPKNFTYDDLTNNLLISGGKIHAIYEFSWNDNDKGSLIWQHGTKISGSGRDELSYPTGVAYDINKQIVYVADSGNKRMKKIYRSGIVENVELINFATKDGVEFGFNTNLNIHTTNDDYIVVESSQEIEKYNENIYLHPSLARALKYNQDMITSKDKLVEYENLLFAPLIGVKD